MNVYLATHVTMTHVSTPRAIFSAVDAIDFQKDRLEVTTEIDRHVAQ